MAVESQSKIGEVPTLTQLLTELQNIYEFLNVDLEGKIDDIYSRLATILATGSSEATLAKMIPIAKASIFNTALPAAEADLLALAITPTNSPSYLRIYVCITVGGVLRVARTIGGVTVTENLNDSVSLTANSAYMFTVEWRSGDSINFRYSATGGSITILRADEIGGAE